ncbi:MAG: MazG nucleotide pyrophosphohydrolase domain-containing protein [Phycisphaerales bacterium]
MPESDPTNPITPPLDMTIRAFQDLIKDRYFASDNARGTAGTFLYLTEEFGELATALANNNRPNKPATQAERENLEEEFADVLAWLATLANINGVDLAATLIKYTDPDRVQGVKD